MNKKNKIIILGVVSGLVLSGVVFYLLYHSKKVKSNFDLTIDNFDPNTNKGEFTYLGVKYPFGDQSMITLEGATKGYIMNVRPNKEHTFVFFRLSHNGGKSLILKSVPLNTSLLTIS